MIFTNKWPVGIGVLMLSCVLSFKAGWNRGTDHIQTKWDAEKIATRLKITRLEQEYSAYEETHKETVRGIAQVLQNYKRKYQDELALIESEYADRVLSSEERANVYKRQSEAGAIERRNLADHAARLDRSLEEGRRLVRELRSALRQREQELGILGSQIKADRQLLHKADMIHE